MYAAETFGRTGTDFVRRSSASVHLVCPRIWLPSAVLRFKTMRFFLTVAIVISASLASYSQDAARQIYDTERAFEKAVG